jgi:hypothetical protein
MKLRSWIAFVLLVPVVVVAAFNLPALLRPVPVDLLVTTVRMPLWPVVLGVPLVLAAVFLGAALLDRARQLRQVAALERQLEEARAVVERGREQALDAAVRELTARLDALESVVEGVGTGMESRLGARLDAGDARREARDKTLGDRMEALAERVARVRDELAADVAEAEDAVLRALHAAERTLDADPEGAPPRLPGGAPTDRL